MMQMAGGGGGGDMSPLMMASMMGKGDLDPIMLAMLAQQEVKPTGVQACRQQFGPSRVDYGNQYMQQQAPSASKIPQMMLMQSMMDGDSTSDMMTNPLLMNAIMGPDAMQPMLVATCRGMASMMSGEDFDNDEVVKAMMMTEAMGGNFLRAASDVSMRAGVLDDAETEEDTELPPVKFAGFDSSWTTSKPPEMTKAADRTSASS